MWTKGSQWPAFSDGVTFFSRVCPSPENSSQALHLLHFLARLQMTAAKLANTVLVYRINRFRCHETGVILTVFKRYYNRFLPLSFPTTFSLLFAAHIRILTFHWMRCQCSPG
jgi:hypothetical protein